MNQYLPQLLTAVQNLEVLMRKGYSALIGINNLTASNASPYIRAAMPNAVRTVITNTGSANLRIQENGIFIENELAPNTTWASPTACSGIVTVDTAAGSTTFSIATYVF